MGVTEEELEEIVHAVQEDANLASNRQAADQAVGALTTEANILHILSPSILLCSRCMYIKIVFLVWVKQTELVFDKRMCVGRSPLRNFEYDHPIQTVHKFANIFFAEIACLSHVIFGRASHV